MLDYSKLTPRDAADLWAREHRPALDDTRKVIVVPLPPNFDLERLEVFPGRIGTFWGAFQPYVGPEYAMIVDRSRDFATLVSRASLVRAGLVPA